MEPDSEPFDPFEADFFRHMQKISLCGTLCFRAPFLFGLALGGSGSQPDFDFSFSARQVAGSGVQYNNNCFFVESEAIPTLETARNQPRMIVALSTLWILSALRQVRRGCVKKSLNCTQVFDCWTGRRWPPL